MAELTQRQVVEQLVTQGRITPEERERILRAPRFVVSLRSVLVAVATVIMSIGLVRLGVALVDEAPKVLLIVLLYCVSLGAGVVAWKWRSHPGWRRTVSEFVELLSLGSAIGATAMIMVDRDIDGHWLAISLGALAAIWGMTRVRSSTFAGVAALIPGSVAVTGGITAWLGLEEGWSAVPFVVAGGLLVLGGQAAFTLSVVVRMAGVVMIVATCPVWLSSENGLVGFLPALVVGTALVASGNARSQLEGVVGGSVIVVATVVSFAFGHIENDVLQGLVVVVVGAIGLMTVALAVRHSSPKHHKLVPELR